MIKQLAAIAATLALLSNPAGATPERRIVNPGELMVLVPGLEELGYSRISTVEHCAELNGIQGDGWMELLTDSQFEGMDACMREHT
jgi:hypothetical protein